MDRGLFSVHVQVTAALMVVRTHLTKPLVVVTSTKLIGVDRIDERFLIE